MQQTFNVLKNIIKQNLIWGNVERGETLHEMPKKKKKKKKVGSSNVIFKKK